MCAVLGLLSAALGSNTHSPADAASVARQIAQLRTNDAGKPIERRDFDLVMAEVLEQQQSAGPDPLFRRLDRTLKTIEMMQRTRERQCVECIAFQHPIRPLALDRIDAK